jgi:phospholipid/cholesterol/gamma-HCH transport system ATP-binding protein
MSENLIEFKNVTKQFGERTILDRVNCTIQEGQTTTIIGKSGVGKSVTLKHIIGLLEPDDGDILFRGRPIKKMRRKERKAMRRQFSYMFQNNALFDSMTVFENIALPLVEKTSFDKAEIERRVVSKVEQLELTEVLHKYPSQISGGMQKRVALARALVTEPKIVLFDEPTTGLDPIRKNAVLGMIAHYQKQLGFTAVVVSHDIPDVFFISNRIIILYDRRVIFQGSPFELEQFDHPLIEEFIHSIRSLKDEVTGMETKRSFERQFVQEYGLVNTRDEFTVILFTIENWEAVEKNAGDMAAQKIIQSLAALIDKHIGVMGISARHSDHDILSILPHTDQKRAENLLKRMGKDLKNQEAIESENTTTACRECSIVAGLAHGKPGMELDMLVAQARSRQISLPEWSCGQES